MAVAEFVVFIGAGASEPFGVPTMQQMVEQFEATLRNKISPQLPLFDEIKSKLRDYRVFDIEALITVLQDIVDIDKALFREFNRPSLHYLSTWATAFTQMLKYTRDDAARNCSQAKQLLNEVKSFVADACSIKIDQYEIYDEFFSTVYEKYGYHYRQDLESQDEVRYNCIIFTTNYDRVLEAYRHRMVDSYCGESERQLLSIQNKDDPRLYSPTSHLFQIHKLHGSINWYIDQKDRPCWSTEAIEAGKTTPLGDKIVRELLIYPVAEKYTFREPFYAMFHHLKDMLTMCKDCYVVGYSFRDDDILGLFYDAFALNNKLHLYLIDPNANRIRSETFSSYMHRITPIHDKFSVNSSKRLFTHH